MLINKRLLGSGQVSSVHGPSRYAKVPSKGSGIRVVGSTTIGSAGVSPLSIGYTADVMAGDLIVATSSTRHGAGYGNAISASGLTFTEISLFAGGTNYCGGAWYAWSPDSTVRTISISTTGGTTAVLGGWVTVLRGVHPTSPLDVAGSQQNPASSTAFALTGMTTKTAGALAFVHLIGNDDSGFQIDDTGWTGRRALLGTTGAQMTAFKSFPVAGATGDINVRVTLSTPDPIKVITFALRAA